jgi:glycosyltransferase involved in cell wall biosynthesis
MDPTTGGPCQGIRNLASVSSNVKREVVCLDSPSSLFLGKDSFIIHALGPANNPWQYSSLLLPWLRGNICRFDAIIVEGLWLYHGYATWKAWKMLEGIKPKLFIVPHGMLDPWFQKDSNRKIKAIRNWLYWKLIENKIINSADGLLFTCETEKLLARTTFVPYRPKNEFNVGYGIPMPPTYMDGDSKWFFRKYPNLNNKPYFLFLSRIHYKKGIDILLRAYESVLADKKDRSSPIPMLVIAGPGIETAYGRTIKEIVSKSKALSDNVFFTGMLKDELKWGALKECEVFILPSHQENFGIAVVEALACSKPVLISNQVNIHYEVSALNAGIICDDSLSEVTNLFYKWFALNELDKENMSKNARLCFEKYFRIEVTASKFDETIASLSNS